MYYRVLIKESSKEPIEVKLRHGILGSAEWGVEEDGKQIPSQIVNVLVNEIEGDRQAWIQVVDSNRKIIHEGIIDSSKGSLEAFGHNVSNVSCSVEPLDEKDAPGCLKKMEGLKRRCCTQTGTRPNGNPCYVRCCNACCGGGWACNASCCP